MTPSTDPSVVVPTEQDLAAVRTRRRRRELALVAILMGAAVAGAAAYLVLFSDVPPVARFSVATSELHVHVNGINSSDPDGGAIATYDWTWGDGSAGTSSATAAASHDYAAAGTYTIRLTVVDGAGLSGLATQSLTLVVLPTASFLARQSALVSTFDASATVAPPGHTITSYAWDFGDGTTGTGAAPSHTYTQPGRYNVSLIVTDNAGETGQTRRYVSANVTSVDVVGEQFFTASCPYAGFWGLRYRTYGDVIIQNRTPCLDYFPWILYQPAPATNPSWLYSLYRMDARVTNNLGYNVSEPVILPVFNASVAPAPDSFIRFNWTFDYLSSADIARWGATAWPVNPKYSDGFGYLVQGNVTMDLQESRRIFGVSAATPAQAQAWWYANTKYGAAAGPLETRYGTWLGLEGNGKYDIWNAFQWVYESDIADLNATVASNGTTTVRFFLDGWGFEVLADRWFYWGNTSYQAAVNAAWGAIPPRGWMPFETCWCDDAGVSGAIGRSLTMSYSATSEYWWMAVGNPGPDGTLGTADDLAGWSWAPSLMDYVPPKGSGLPGESSYPNSELRWYTPNTDLVTSPGSYAYGQAYEFMIVPNRWNTSLGNSLTLVLPTTPVPWADPVQSRWDAVNRIADYSIFERNLTLRGVGPGAGYWLWDDRGKVLSIAWPSGYAWVGAASRPTESSPYIEFGPAASIA